VAPASGGQRTVTVTVWSPGLNVATWDVPGAVARATRKVTLTLSPSARVPDVALHMINAGSEVTDQSTVPPEAVSRTVPTPLGGSVIVVGVTVSVTTGGAGGGVVLVGVGDGFGVRVGRGVGVGTVVSVGAGVGVSVGARVGLAVGVGWAVGVGVGVGVGRSVRVGVGATDCGDAGTPVVAIGAA
jgi:hypothetical protein